MDRDRPVSTMIGVHTKGQAAHVVVKDFPTHSEPFSTLEISWEDTHHEITMYCTDLDQIEALAHDIIDRVVTAKKMRAEGMEYVSAY